MILVSAFHRLAICLNLPVSELKIDRSFISALDEPGTLAVVRQLFNLRKLQFDQQLQKESKRKDILKFYVHLGCKVGQGFYYYKPMPLQEIDRLLAE